MNSLKIQCIYFSYWNQSCIVLYELHWITSGSRRLFVATHEDFSKKLLAYASPMDTLLYITIFGNMVGLAFILYFIERLSLYFLPIKEEADSWSLVSWYMTSAFLQQGKSTCVLQTVCYTFICYIHPFCHSSVTLATTLHAVCSIRITISLRQIAAQQTNIFIPSKELPNLWSNLLMHQPAVHAILFPCHFFNRV